jgi:hypothetical protein
MPVTRHFGQPPHPTDPPIEVPGHAPGAAGSLSPFKLLAVLGGSLPSTKYEVDRRPLIHAARDDIVLFRVDRDE